MRQMVYLTPVDPPGPRRGVELADRSLAGGGVGGWEPVQRPRLTEAVEWQGTPLRTLVIPMALVGLSDDPAVADVEMETAMTRVESWSRRTAATGQPPVFTVSGPVRHLGLKWVVSGVEWDNDTYEANAAGARIQQFGTLSLLEYSAAAVLVVGNPVRKARGKKGKPKHPKTVVVRPGDTLPKVAARELRSAKRWVEIARLNKIRDGESLKVGKVLKLPA